MTWRVNVGATILALVLLGLLGIWLSLPRPLDADVEDLVGPWAAHLDEVDRSLAAGDHARAMRAWTEAWSAALASHRWAPLLDVGDAALRVGDATGSASIGRPNARQAYRAALIRARAQRSADGVLRAAERFAALGDREATRSALAAARKLAAGTPDTSLRARVEVDADRIAARVVTP